MPKLVGDYKSENNEFFISEFDFEYARKLATSKKFIQSIIRSQEKAFKEFRAYITKYKSFKVKNNHQSLSLLKVFANSVRDFSFFFFSGLMLDSLLMERILNEVNFEEAVFFVRPKKKSELSLEMEELWKIRNEAEKLFGSSFYSSSPEKLAALIKSGNPDFSRRLLRHEGKYSYLSTQFFRGEPWTLVDYIKRAQSLSDDKNKLDRQKQPKVAISLSKEMEETLYSVRLLNEQRARRIEYFNKWIYTLSPLWDYCLKRFNFSKVEFINCTFEELKTGLRTGEFPCSKEELFLRSKGYFVDWSKKQSVFKSAPIKHESIQDVVEFGGMPTYKGFVRGTVSVVRGSGDFSKFKDGSVLVAPLTTPNFMVVLSKAKAIITDIGGITSHSAIVSRELGIPCIVGTKIATKVLKDGDLVEVDAERGIVKIINRK